MISTNAIAVRVGKAVVPKTLPNIQYGRNMTLNHNVTGDKLVGNRLFKDNF